MDTNTTSFLPNPPQDKGAGGKLRKPPSRRPPSTPYARPQQNRAQRGRWLYKLVDPAFRLVYGGANLIFPSFFSKLRSDNALPSPSTLEENHGTEVEEQYAVADGGNLTQNNVESRETQLAGNNSNLDLNGLERKQKVQVSDSDGLSEIERLLKDKKFSRDEINHLVEIINSRVDHRDIEQENKCAVRKVGDLIGSGAIDYSGKSTGAKQKDLKATLWETSRSKEKIYSTPISLDAGKPVPLENFTKYTKERNEDLDRFIRRSSPKLRDDVGSSPIDIARAYMEHRASEVGLDTSSSLSRDEETLPHSNELVAKPSPAPRSIPHWPGALVQDQHDFMTPQTQRKRFGLQNFPRTPYSRSIHSRTKSRLMQLQGNSDRHPSIMATPFWQALTPSEQVYSKRNTLNGGDGSAGPSRRVWHKVNAETPSRGSVNFKASFNSAEMKYFSNSESLFSAPKKIVENEQIDNNSMKYQSFGSKPQNTEVSAPSVPAHSSQVARKILEHLDRNPPTPKDKSAELRLASSWKKSQQLTGQPTFIPNELNELSNLGGIVSSKAIQVDKGNPRESANKVNKVVNNTTASGIKFATALTHGNTGPSQDTRKALDAQHKGAREDVSKVSSNVAGSEVLSLQNKLSPRTSSAKPMLSSIAIDKPIERWAFSSDNSLGFSFPVSAASGGSSEPPTPTMPTFSAAGQVQQSEESTAPSYSFGSRKSTPPLVFSFPSTSSSSILEDASDLKFSFGSDEPRISFASVGQDAICY